MIILSLKNIEEKIFLNKDIEKQFPEFKTYFYLWRLSKQHAFMKSVGTQAALDLLNNLNENHLSIIKNYYNCDVKLAKFSNKIVDNFDYKINNIDLENMPDICNLALYRNKDELFITTWI